MTKHRPASIKPYQFLFAFILIALQTGPAGAQETVIIGGSRNGPAVEVDYGVLNNTGAARLGRKKSSLPDLLPPDAANQPLGRATSTQRLSPPVSTAKAPAPIAPPPANVMPGSLTPAPLAPGLTPAAIPAQTPSAALKASEPPKPIETAKPAPAPAQNLAALPGSTPAAPAGAGVNAALLFAAGSVDLSTDATAQLDALISLLKPQDRVQLKSHATGAANDAEARRVALKRALAARSHLLANGVDSTRIDVRALGPAGDGGSDDRIDVIVLTP